MGRVFRFFLVAIMLVALTPALFTGCKKGKEATAGHTHSMGGVRKWRGSFALTTSDRSGNVTRTAYTYPDTSFAISILDDENVYIFGAIHSFEQEDVQKHILYFGTAHNYFKYASGRGVAYFYDRDSIVYVSGEPGSRFNRNDIRYSYK